MRAAFHQLRLDRLDGLPGPLSRGHEVRLREDRQPVVPTGGAAGQRVVILTGCGAEKPELQDIADKEDYLQHLGLGAAYDQLVVFGDPTADLKAEWLKANHADLLIDNSKTNAKAAPCLVLVPWQTKVD